LKKIKLINIEFYKKNLISIIVNAILLYLEDKSHKCSMIVIVLFDEHKKIKK